MCGNRGPGFDGRSDTSTLADAVTAAISGNFVDALRDPVAVLEAAAGTMINPVNLISI